MGLYHITQFIAILKMVLLRHIPLPSKLDFLKLKSRVEYT